jgi:hypothetical protein
MNTNTNPLFGRRYQLQVKAPPQNGNQTVITITDSAWEPEALRITFDIQQVWWHIFWVATICIYNPNEQLANFLLTQGQNSTSNPSANSSGQAVPMQQGMEVILTAGYQSPGHSGVIWDGYVLQPMFERENQTDFKVTLNCIIGLNQDSRNTIGTTIGSGVYAAGIQQQEIVAAIASKAYHPISTTGTSIPSSLTKTLPRGKVVFGRPSKYLSEIARDNNMRSWLDAKGVFNMVDLNKSIPTTALVYTPTTGVVGTPVQTQFGANVRLLLDPRVTVKNPPMAIQINNAIIRQLQKQVGDLPSSLSILSQDGVYVVIGTRYLGDTRGQEWYTDVTGWLTAAEKLAAIEAAFGVQLHS